MTFPLSEQLVSGIVNALENQQRRFLVDAEAQSLVDAEGVIQDENRFYGLPKWNSAAGFALRMDFVEKLRSERAKNELRRVLHSGRGVFKSFKNTLREFPEAEKLWHRHKNAAMRRIIGDWYSTLCDVWGLERLELEIEDYGEHVYDDFSFSEYALSDFQDVSRCFFLRKIRGGVGFYKRRPYRIVETTFPVSARRWNGIRLPKRSGGFCRIYNCFSHFRTRISGIRLDWIVRF